MILRKKSISHLPIEEVEYHVTEEESLSSKELLELKLNALEEALENLNEDQAYCIRAFYLNRKSYEEISANSRYSLNEIKSHIQNGKRNLKIIVSKITEKL